MRRAGGHALIELLVASSCTGLLAAGVLALMVDTAGIVRDRMARMDATLRVERCSQVLAKDLRNPARGLGLRVPLMTAQGLLGRIEPTVAGVTVALASAALTEVDELAERAYRVGDPGGLALGMRVAAVGLSPAAPAVPLGAVVRVVRTPPVWLIRVAWDAAQLRILRQHGPTTGLLPLTLRTYQARLAATGMEIRRRDDGGAWQPVVDGLSGVDIGYSLVGEAGGLGPLSAAAALPLSADLARARIDCAAVASGEVVRSVQWAGIGHR